MSESARSCRLCYTDFEIIDTNEGMVILKCGCFSPIIKGISIEDAYNKLDQFETELDQGANLWGSKIQNGVAED